MSVSDCRKYAERYLDFLLLKNKFYYRVNVTSKYEKILSAESNTEARKSIEKNFRRSVHQMTLLSRELESLLDDSVILFNLLLECVKLYGSNYSPNVIFNNNAANLKHLNKVGSI